MLLPAPIVMPIESPITNQCLAGNLLPIRILPFSGRGANSLSLFINENEKKYEFPNRDVKTSTYVALTKEELQAAGNGECIIRYHVEASLAEPMRRESELTKLILNLT